MTYRFLFIVITNAEGSTKYKIWEICELLSTIDIYITTALEQRKIQHICEWWVLVCAGSSVLMWQVGEVLCTLPSFMLERRRPRMWRGLTRLSDEAGWLHVDDVEKPEWAPNMQIIHLMWLIINMWWDVIEISASCHHKSNVYT